MPPTEIFIKKRGSQLISTMPNNVFYGVTMANRNNIRIASGEKHGDKENYHYSSSSHGDL
ncbi:hypothetical protein BDQ17DRAFT_1428128 [Cyathus striatus]|nr:hypothetical protein BDQ17DRAFT_1428128 [Cyathus striatus]